MKAMLLERNAPIHERPLRLTEVAEPDPGDGEIVVRVSACAICRTDLHVIEGDLPARRLPVATACAGITRSASLRILVNVRAARRARPSEILLGATDGRRAPRPERATDPAPAFLWHCEPHARRVEAGLGAT